MKTEAVNSENGAREVVLEFPSDITLVPILEAVVSRIASDLRFDKDTVEQIAISVIEAGMNAIKHGNKYDVKKTVHCHFRIDPETYTIIIRDEGPGFDPNRIADPLSEQGLLKDSGRGLFMIRAYMDDVYYNENGTQITMMKKLPS